MAGGIQACIYNDLTVTSSDESDATNSEYSLSESDCISTDEPDDVVGKRILGQEKGSQGNTKSNMSESNLQNDFSNCCTIIPPSISRVAASIYIYLNSCILLTLFSFTFASSAFLTTFHILHSYLGFCTFPLKIFVFPYIFFSLDEYV